ncbi:MAG: DUF4493 domain-containing protein [Bacteroidaceae bacterium]|nr:DUF4493 domain-containing protein [Bacteroidaceae bacterium]
MKKIFSIISVLALALAAVSCSNDTDELASKEVGYLKLGIETNSTTMTRAGAPTGYDAKKLHVEVQDAQGTVVAQTDDFDNDTELKGQQITLTPGQYKVVAHSSNWDGNGSGIDTPYYYGETTVTVKTKTLTTAKVTCTLANVKVTVNFSQEFIESFARATATIESAVSGVSSQTFTMGQEKGAAYFPVGNLTATLSVFNKSGQGYSNMKEITDVQARDHYIINYTVAAHGYQGGVTVKVDPTTNTYTYTFEVPRKGGTSLAAYSANAWSTFAYLEGGVTAKKGDFDTSNLQLQWKADGTETWNTVAASDLTIDGDNISYKLTGLTPSTKYAYRMAYITDEDEIFSADQEFTTEAQPALQNSSFENWHQDGVVVYPNAEGTTYWDSSNKGSAGATNNANNNVTTSTTDVKHSGTYAAQLKSKKVLIAFAAASIYTGELDHLVGTKGAVLNWGVPFAGRPTSLKGWYRYDPVAIDNSKNNQPATAPAKGEMDQCAIYWALTTSVITVDNTDIDGTFPNWDTDSRVVAYGQLPISQCTSTNGELVEFEIPVEYHSLTTKPTHLIICASSSRYGDYFHGGAGSTLYLDDFELIYGDTPTVKQ